MSHLTSNFLTFRLLVPWIFTGRQLCRSCWWGKILISSPSSLRRMTLVGVFILETFTSGLATTCCANLVSGVPFLRRGKGRKERGLSVMKITRYCLTSPEKISSSPSFIRHGCRVLTDFLCGKSCSEVWLSVTCSRGLATGTEKSHRHASESNGSYPWCHRLQSELCGGLVRGEGWEKGRERESWGWMWVSASTLSSSRRTTRLSYPLDENVSSVLSSRFLKQAIPVSLRCFGVALQLIVWVTLGMGVWGCRGVGSVLFFIICARMGVVYCN